MGAGEECCALHIRGILEAGYSRDERSGEHTHYVSDTTKVQA
jgi:hypothetical protein